MRSGFGQMGIFGVEAARCEASKEEFNRPAFGVVVACACDIVRRCHNKEITLLEGHTVNYANGTHR